MSATTDANALRAFASYPFSAPAHAAVLPALSAGVEPQRHPVAIIGGGIAGLAAALALATYGVRSVVLEADATVCVGSRAICISRRSLEILARLGALEPFVRTGLPWSGGRSFYRNAEVLRFSMPHASDQRLPPMINIQQYYVEQFLLDALERTALAQVRWQTRVGSLASHADHVRLEVDTPLGGYGLEADWVLGCDGARSLVRESAGLTFTGTRYEGRYVIVDVALKSERPTERLAWFDPPSNPGSTILMHRQPDDVWRIDYQLRDDEDPERAVRPENVIPRVASHLKMIGEREDWAPIWMSLYRANALTLESYRSGRLLLAGDAAHLVPIFGVRGANSAFEDVDNLAWKLALVISGAASDALLESFSIERVQAARENLREGMKSTEFMSPPSYGFELLRRAVLGLAVDHEFIRPLINPRQTQPIDYVGSPVNQRSRGAFAQGPEPGSVARECPLTLVSATGARAGHLTELLGPRFTALCFTRTSELPGEWSRLKDELARARIPFAAVSIAREPASGSVLPSACDASGRAFSAYGAEPGDLYLLRPDGYVLARWRSGSPAEVREAIAGVLRGACPGERAV